MNGREVINKFLDALLDDSIPSKKIASDFLVWDKNDTKDNPEERIKGLDAYVQMARHDRNKSGNDWKLINPQIFTLKQRNIFNYKDYEQLDTLHLNIAKSEEKNVFVLLNPEKKNILQYFWVKNGKILSFHLFIQVGLMRHGFLDTIEILMSCFLKLLFGC
ncbi:MAG: hypothetical protein AAGA86_05475 [Bacteroidota bacterium]